MVDDAVRDVATAGAQQPAIWKIAEALADQSCRAVSADDLRHACHIHALGKDVSHKDFTNAQFDRVLLLLGNERDIPGLLIEPDHIKSQTLWDNPDIARKDSLIRSLRAAASHKYICAITQDVYGTIFWEDLDANTLAALLRRIKMNAPAMMGQPF
jgi:hypothetical protein